MICLISMANFGAPVFLNDGKEILYESRRNPGLFFRYTKKDDRNRKKDGTSYQRWRCAGCKKVCKNPGLVSKWKNPIESVDSSVPMFMKILKNSR